MVREDLSGKTVIVVGANTGLGYESAKHFATMGASRVIMACRSKERGAAAVERLREETSTESAKLSIVDLTDMASMKSFAAELETRCERIDLLVLNAGALPKPKPEITKDGWETIIQVNVLGSSLLSLLLLPRLLETARKYHTMPRIVIVGSGVHYWAGALDKKTSNSPEILRALSDLTDGFVPPRRYQESKRAYSRLI